jgi:hypothetical protein
MRRSLAQWRAARAAGRSVRVQQTAFCTWLVSESPLPPQFTVDTDVARSWHRGRLIDVNVFDNFRGAPARARGRHSRGWSANCHWHTAMVGNTPLVRLNGPSRLTGCNIYGKCEVPLPSASAELAANSRLWCLAPRSS